MKYLHKQEIFNLRLAKRIYKNKMHMSGHSSKEIHKNIKKIEEQTKKENQEENEKNSKVGKKIDVDKLTKETNFKQSTIYKYLQEFKNKGYIEENDDKTIQLTTTGKFVML